MKHCPFMKASNISSGVKNWVRPQIFHGTHAICGAGGCFVRHGRNNTTESLLHMKHSSNSKRTKLVGKYYEFIEVQ